MTRTPTFPIRSTAFAALLLAALLAGCASADLNRKNEKLDKSLSIFNKQFESKMTDNVLPMIHKDAREKFALGGLDRAAETVVPGMICVTGGAPGAVEALRFIDVQTLQWQPVDGSSHYELLRGVLSSPAGPGGVHHGAKR